MAGSADNPRVVVADLPARRAGTGYDRAASAHTVVGITDGQLTAVRAAAQSFTHGAWFGEINPAGLVEFLYLTACHPDVLADPKRANLRCTAEVDGKLHVRWTRPKKRGLSGEMDLPVADLGGAAAKWIPNFIKRTRDRPYTTRHLNNLLRAIGELAGVPLSARVLRHTRGVDIGRRTRNPAAVAFWLNCSETTAQQYLRVSGSSDPQIQELAAG